MHDMEGGRAIARRGSGLDRLSFLVAALQTGFGPFIVVYLASQGWHAAQIGWVVTTGTLVGMFGQVPAGLLVERLSARVAATGAIAALGAAAALLALSPALPSAMAATALQGFAGCVLALAISALTLGEAGHAGLAVRMGRILRLGAVGNALGAAVMGACGNWICPAAAIWLAALLCLPALLTLRGEAWPAQAPLPPRRGVRPGLGGFASPGLGGFASPGLAGFVLFAFAFHLANGSLLLLAAADMTASGGARANLMVAGCVVVPQFTLALLSARMGGAAERFGRRRVMLLGLAALPLRALLFAVLHDPVLLVAAQALDGVSGAAFGLLVPLTASDLTKGRGGFTVVTGTIGLAAGLGAAVSTALAGGLAAAAGAPFAFLALAAAGTMAVLLYAVLARPPARRALPAPDEAAARGKPPVPAGLVPAGLVPAGLFPAGLFSKGLAEAAVPARPQAA